MTELSAGALQQFGTAMLQLFEGLCELEAMKIANSERFGKGEAIAYTEEAFMGLQQGTIGRVRESLEWVR